jgi:hypothetical protein
MPGPVHVELRVKPYGKDKWIVTHIRATRSEHPAGTINRVKHGALVTFKAFDANGRLLPGVNYTLLQAEENIRKHHRD